jgi:hypothetical protein
LKQATRAYKAARTGENRTDLQAAINTLQGLLQQARDYAQPKAP